MDCRAVRIVAYSYVWRYRAVSRGEVDSVAPAFYHFAVHAVLMRVFLQMGLALQAR
jgi:hypothetical protein